MFKNNYLDNIIITFFTHQLQIKMFYFQTGMYVYHQASESYLLKYDNNLNKFFESAQSVFGKFDMGDLELKAKLPKDYNIEECLKAFRKYLNNISEPLNKYTELLSIKDKILGDLDQFEYLLSFK
jgi:hypothetical protein